MRTKTKKTLARFDRKLCLAASALAVAKEDPTLFFLAVQRLKKALREWADTGEDVPTGLFSDAVHGEIELCHLGDPQNAHRADPNELYQLVGSDNGQVVMTGAEFESITQQWRSFRKGWKR